jgi:hypothetical protein
MSSRQRPQNHRVFWAAVGLVIAATAGLPLLALAWWQTRKMLDDFGEDISPAVQWFSDWQTQAFVCIALACMAAYAVLFFSTRERPAILAAMAIAAGATLVEASIAFVCIVLPVAKLVRDLS